MPVPHSRFSRADSPVVQTYLEDVWRGRYERNPGARLKRIRTILENEELSPRDRQRLNGQRRVLESGRPLHKAPGRPTRKEAEELRLRRRHWELEKFVLDEAKRASFNRRGE